MNSVQKPMGFFASLAFFSFFSIILILETRFLIPFLSIKTGLEPIVFWFIVAGLGMFLPLILVGIFVLRKEGVHLTWEVWPGRLRFRKMNPGDWLWALGGIAVIGASSGIIMKLLELILDHVDSQPPFMQFETLTPGRYWILLVWLPYWLLNIMGEEIVWRGVILPKQEVVFGAQTWMVHAFCWGLFHIAFGWQLLLVLLPILIIQPYIVQQRQNSWIGVVIHAVINGPSFIAISFGLI